jgi:hypothetical protein
MLVEILRNGRVVIDELDDEDYRSGADQVHGFHIETAASRRAWDKQWMAPESDSALIREIQRGYPDWTPAPDIADEFAAILA